LGGERGAATVPPHAGAVKGEPGADPCSGTALGHNGPIYVEIGANGERRSNLIAVRIVCAGLAPCRVLEYT
jgi:hypothetical protein